MKFLESTINIFTSILKMLGLAWWVEVSTNNPACIYYFGPFLSEREAKAYQAGYIEDLEQEGAQIVAVDIKQYNPKELTICNRESLETSDSRQSSATSHFAKSQ